MASAPSAAAASAPSVALPPEPLVVRAALSKRASERLGGLRVLRLLELELDDRTALSGTAVGPLAGDIIRIWIDTPSPHRALIEVRRTDRSVSRRKLSIRGFTPDMSARLVAIAVSEMVYTQARPAREPLPSEPTPGPISAAHPAHPWAGIAASGSLSALWIPASSPELLFGPELSLGYRRFGTGQQLYARWLMNSLGDHKLRWFEVGAGVDVRLVLPEPSWRMHLGARAGGVALGLPEAVAINGAPSGTDSWTARGAALVGIEAHLPDTGWLELSVEPGAILRSLEVSDLHGSSWFVGGFAMNVNLALHVEAAFDPPAEGPRASAPTATAGSGPERAGVGNP